MNDGVLGENLTTGTRDTRMLAKAVRQGWEIPDEVFSELPRWMLDIAAKSQSERNRIAAAKVLTTMHKSNQADDPAPQTVNHNSLHAHVVIGVGTDDERASALLTLLDSELDRRGAIGADSQGGVAVDGAGGESPP